MHVMAKKAVDHRPRAMRRERGFTLIEILIVIGIMAFMSSIILGTITRIGASNRRMTCQSNLAQIYLACRLYQQDETGFPFYDDANLVTTNPNIGLWALYTFPKLKAGVFVPNPDGPVGRYIRSSRVLHCPQDNDPLQFSEPNMMDTAGNIREKYLSYQRADPDDGTSPYKSVRTTNPTDSYWRRQLLSYNGTNLVDSAPAADTIVTWCPYHRKAVGGRDFDNVLFYDGSVQILPRQQDDSSTGWQRLPRAPS